MKEFQGYDQSHRRLHVYFRSLLEDHRRRHAAVEALKIGFGGVAYVARVLGMSRRTIYTGIGELEAMGNDDHPPQRPSGGAKRIRRPGGGRRQVTQRQLGLEEVVDEVLEAHSAGSPTDEAVRWTDLGRCSWRSRYWRVGITSAATPPPSCWHGSAIGVVPCTRR